MQTLVQHGADVAARDEVGAAGVTPLAWRSARECLHAMFVGAIVWMEMCARNRARLCCCAGAAACVEVDAEAAFVAVAPPLTARLLSRTGGPACT